MRLIFLLLGMVAMAVAITGILYIVYDVGACQGVNPNATNSILVCSPYRTVG